LALFAFLLYANTLGHGYVGDDYLAMSMNPNIQHGITGIFKLFTQPYRDQCFGGCLYRPLTLSFFSLEWMIAPKNPFIGHLINVICYAATGALLYLTLKRLLPDQNRIVAFITCIFFIVHPIHTEVVANIKSRDEILSLFFMLLSVYLFAGWHKTHSWKSILFASVSFLAALLSKESAITAIVVFPFMGWMFYKKSLPGSLKSSWWIVVPVALFFLLRANALSGMTEPPIHMLDNPIVDAHGTERWGTAFFILLKYFLLLLFPYQLISDYSYNALPLHALSSAGSIAGILLYFGLAVYAVVGMLRKQISGFFVAAFLASISLYSQLVILIGTIMGERLAYLPSLWFILAAFAIGTEVSRKNGNSFLHGIPWKQASSLDRIVMVVLAGIFLWFSVKTFVRNKDWESDYTLQKADVAKSPESVRLNYGYAEEIYQSLATDAVTPEEVTNRLALSEQYAKKSIAIHPGITAYTNMANISMLRKDYPEALNYYLKIVEISADRGIAERNVASFLVYWAKEETEINHNATHALELLNQALQYNANDSQAWHGLAVVHYGLGHMNEAQQDFEKAYSLSPENAALKSDLAKFYLSQGMNDKAEALQ
jgi:tetratricopeptide (TPR) repeat protein